MVPTSIPRRPRSCAICLCAALVFSLSVPRVAAYYSESAITVPPGFNVYDVRQDEGSQRMHVVLNVSGGDQVHPILYFTPKQQQTSSGPDTFDVTNHPCASAHDICCLKQFYQTYGILDAPLLPGQVCDSDGSTIESPSSENSNLAPLSFPGALLGSKLFDGAESAYSAGMSVSTEGTGSNRQVSLQFPIDYLDQNTGGGAHARVSKTGENEWKYEFYVGVVFISTRSDSAGVFMNVMQHNIEFTKSEYMFFSVASQQERTPVQSVDLFVHQGKSNDNRLMQYVEFFMGYDKSVYEQVSVTLPSIKYAKAVSYEDAVWKLPCGQPGFRQGVNKSFYDDFEDVACLPHDPHFCQCVGGRLWIPFDREDATEAHGYISGPDFVNVIFIQMMVELVTFDGEVVLANVFASVDLSSYPVLEHCTTSITEFQSIADVIHVAASTGVEGPTGTALSLSENFDGGFEEMGADGYEPAPSYASAAISMEFNMGRYFKDDFGRANEIQVDSLVVMNFLQDDGTVYDAMKASITSGQGFNVVRSGEGASVELNIVPNIDAGSCEKVESNDLSGVNFNCMWREVINNGAVVPAFEESVFFMDTMAPHEKTQSAHEAESMRYTDFLAWFDDTYQTGTTPGSLRGRDYLYSRCKAYDGKLSEDVADIAFSEKQAYTPLRPHGDYSCLFIDPGYRWVSRAAEQTVGSTYDISDKTIVAGIVTIRGTNGVISGRRLLTLDGDGIKLRQLEGADDEHGADSTAQTRQPRADASSTLADSAAAEAASLASLREADVPSEESRYAAAMRSVGRADGVSSQGATGGHVAHRRMLNAKSRIEERYAAQSARDAADAPRTESETKHFGSVGHGHSHDARGAGPRDATGQHVPHRRMLENKAQLEARYLRSQEKYGPLAPPSPRAAAAGTRRLLAADGSTADGTTAGGATDKEHLEKLRTQPGNAVLSVSNPGVDANVNIAHMTGHSNASWQVFSAEVQRDAGVAWPLFKGNMDMMMMHAGGNLGPGVRSSNITGYHSLPRDAAADGGRRLLQLVSADGFGATVRLNGILRMSAKFGALYAHMFKCMLAAGAGATFPITHLSAINETRACASQSDASSETQAVVDALLGDCGFGAEKLSLAVCNRLYQPLVYTAPTVAFDWHHVADTGQEPVLFFSMEPGIEITPTNQVAAVYSARTNLAIVFSVPMDRILIEARDAVAAGSARRLLAASKKVFHVWIYGDTGNRGNGVTFPPAGATPADVYAAQRDNVVQSLAGVLGDVRVPETPETAGTGFSLRATMPRLKRYAMVVQVDVTGDPVRGYRTSNAAEIVEITREQVGVALSVDLLDLRVLTSFELLDTNTIRIAIEARFDSAAAARTHVARMRTLAPAAAAQIKSKLVDWFITPTGSQNWIKSVEMPVSTINTLFDGTVGGGGGGAEADEPGEGLGAGAIAAIVLTCCVVVLLLLERAGVLKAVWVYFGKPGESAPVVQERPPANVPHDGHPTAHPETLFGPLHGAPGSLPGKSLTPVMPVAPRGAYNIHDRQWQLARQPYQALSLYDMDTNVPVGAFAPQHVYGRGGV